MPIHLPPISRRRFLSTSLAAGAGLLTLRDLRAADRGADAHRFALLADTHIPSDPATMRGDTNMAANLTHVVGELTALDTKPAAVFIDGDCAFLKGLPQDYALFAKLIEPLSKSDLPVHMTMGNHDDRGPFATALDRRQPQAPPVEGKFVSVLQAPRANWFLLDSLLQVNVVTGELGQAQIDWLASALDAHKDKPAIVMVHHNPQFKPAANGKYGGLKDSVALFDMLAPRRHVKAVIFGHTHVWSLGQHEGIHLINLPPVAYLFKAGLPNGWTDAHLRPDGLTLQLNCLDKQHALAGKSFELAWRA